MVNVLKVTDMWPTLGWPRSGSKTIPLTLTESALLITVGTESHSSLTSVILSASVAAASG